MKFSCIFWWLLLGFAAGWLANWLLCRCCCKHNTPSNNADNTQSNNNTLNNTTHTDTDNNTANSSMGLYSANTINATDSTATQVNHTLTTSPNEPETTEISSTQTTLDADTHVDTDTASNINQTTAGLASVAPIATINLDAAKAAGFKLKHPDDLTIIEGIGPKINQLFIDADISTFAQLSQTPVEKMQQVLTEAGSRFSLANPETWAEQATLAANNQWQALKALQDELDGGRRRS